MANRIVSVHAWIYGMGIYAIMLPFSWFSVALFNNYDVIMTHVIFAQSYITIMCTQRRMG